LYCCHSYTPYVEYLVIDAEFVLLGCVISSLSKWCTVRKEENVIPYIFRTYKTLSNGKRIYASQYGKKAFCFYVEEYQQEQKAQDIEDETAEE